MGIVKQSTTYSNNEGIVLDMGLLERVFTLPIFIVKSLPLKCDLAFSHASKDALLKIVAKPTSIGV